MYRVKDFENIIRSNLSDEEVVEKIMSILSNDKTNLYYDGKKMGYHQGFINENTYIPMTYGFIGDVSIKLDERDIYLQVVKEVREKLANGNSYEISSI